jgi:peptidoglycan/xylan/chitin deacetylase (PgdA/CDA1 family)
MYHGIHNHADDEGYFDPVYSLTEKQFEEQLAWLDAHDYQAVTLPEALSNQFQKPVVISFDDGDISNYNKALPLLKKFGMRAEFYVTTDWIGNKNSMSAAHINELEKIGMRIQSHGHTHSYLDDLTYESIFEEVRQSVDALNAIIDQRIDTIALPGGRANSDLLKIASCQGIKYICRSTPGYNNTKTDHHYINRFAMTADISINDFSQLMKKHGVFPLKLMIKYKFLRMAKNILGNANYNRIRSNVFNKL